MTPRDALDRARLRQRTIGGSLCSDPAWEILLDLADAGPLKTSAVGGSTRVPGATVLRYLSRLEARSLIRRFSDPDDRRLTLVELTEQGRDAVERCLA